MAGNNWSCEDHARAIAAGITLLIVCLWSGCSNEKVDLEKFQEERLICPAPAVAEFESWSKSGRQQVCKIKHGPFVAWEAGYVQLRGQYEYGKESGTWYWYDKDGTVLKKIEYSGGKGVVQ